MKFTIAVLFAATAFAAPLLDRRDIFDDYTPGIEIAPACRTFAVGNVCPAQLKDDNMLVTSRNIVVKEDPAGKGEPNNIIRAGFANKSGKLSEESTLTIFTFPDGYTDKKCRFQFVSDDGDRIDPTVNYYNVWALSGTATVDTTWTTRPARENVLATFTTSKTAYTTENNKFIHGFVFGPGEGAPVYKDLDGVPQDTFPCPSGGTLSYEVAPAIKNSGTISTMNIGGNSGLGIEIIGVKSKW